MAKEHKDPKVEALRNIQRELFHINQTLEGVIHPKILEKLQSLYNLAEQTIKPEMDAEREASDNNWKALSKIQEDNKFRSVWSMSDVNAKDMNKTTPEMTEIVYESWGPTQVHKFDKPTKLTWFQFWNLAEELIKKSGDEHHIFIEMLKEDKKKPGSFRMSTGS